MKIGCKGIAWPSLVVLAAVVGFLAACQGKKNGPVVDAAVGRSIRLAQLVGVWSSCHPEDKQKQVYSFFSAPGLSKGTLRIAHFSDDQCLVPDDSQTDTYHTFNYSLGAKTLAGGFLDLVFKEEGKLELILTVEYSFADDSVSALTLPDIRDELAGFDGEQTVKLSLNLAEQGDQLVFSRLTNASDTEIIRAQLAEALRTRLVDNSEVPVSFVNCQEDRVGRLVTFFKYEDEVIKGRFASGVFADDGCTQEGAQTTAFDFAMTLKGPEDFSKPFVLNTDILVPTTGKTIKTVIELEAATTAHILLIDLNGFKDGLDTRFQPDPKNDKLTKLDTVRQLHGTWQTEFCFAEDGSKFNHRYRFVFALDQTAALVRDNYLKVAGEPPCTTQWSTETFGGITFHTGSTAGKTVIFNYLSQEAMTYEVTGSGDYPDIGYYQACARGDAPPCLLQLNEFLQATFLVVTPNYDTHIPYINFIGSKDKDIRYEKN